METARDTHVPRTDNHPIGEVTTNVLMNVHHVLMETIIITTGVKNHGAAETIVAILVTIRSNLNIRAAKSTIIPTRIVIPATEVLPAISHVAASSAVTASTAADRRALISVPQVPATGTVPTSSIVWTPTSNAADTIREATASARNVMATITKADSDRTVSVRITTDKAASNPVRAVSASVREAIRTETAASSADL